MKKIAVAGIGAIGGIVGGGLAIVGQDVALICIKSIERGQLKPGLGLVDAMLAATAAAAR